MSSSIDMVLRAFVCIIFRDVLRQEPTGLGPRASTASSRSRLSLNKKIRIIPTVKCYFRLYSAKHWEFRTTYHLATCDDRLVQVQSSANPHAPSSLIQSNGGSRSSQFGRLCHAHLFVILV
ncbi:hypothetical protein TNCV_1474151 [Trichonephila clavipes]|nr:hypothetical protein TNCV_1474151 [Trichonephila clavipes]